MSNINLDNSLALAQALEEFSKTAEHGPAQMDMGQVMEEFAVALKKQAVDLSKHALPNLGSLRGMANRARKAMPMGRARDLVAGGGRTGKQVAKTVSKAPVKPPVPAVDPAALASSQRAAQASRDLAQQRKALRQKGPTPGGAPPPTPPTGGATPPPSPTPPAAGAAGAGAPPPPPGATSQAGQQFNVPWGQPAATPPPPTGGGEVPRTDAQKGFGTRAFDWLLGTDRHLPPSPEAVAARSKKGLVGELFGEGKWLKDFFSGKGGEAAAITAEQAKTKELAEQLSRMQHLGVGAGGMYLLDRAFGGGGGNQPPSIVNYR